MKNHNHVSMSKLLFSDYFHESLDRSRIMDPRTARSFLILYDRTSFCFSRDANQITRNMTPLKPLSIKFGNTEVELRLSR